MIITKEIIMTVLIAFGVGKYSEITGPKYYELATEDGKYIMLKFKKM